MPRIELPILITTADAAAEEEKAEKLGMSYSDTYLPQKILCFLDEIGPISSNELNGRPITYASIAGIPYFVDVPYEKLKRVLVESDKGCLELV